MATYRAYLEIDGAGRCLAHVLSLPGCIVRAPSREEALAQLPAAIRSYHSWLRRHGESVEPEAAVEVEIAEVQSGLGPFERRSRAALFAPDKQPLSVEELERHLQLLTYSRSDLLDLVGDLSDELLDWQPHAASFSLRSLLRHVGNAEQWYVSRLVPAGTLPEEWAADEEMPLFEFLEMERRTATARLQRLTTEERSATIYPTAWSYHPEEPWTARKALRRFVEHEREHTDQARQLLETRRQWLLARLAAARAELLEQLLGLSTETLVESPLVGEWTVLDTLVHISAWIHWAHQVMEQMVAGEEPDIRVAQNEATIDAKNADFVRVWRDRTDQLSPSVTVPLAITELEDALAQWMGWLEQLPIQELFRRRRYDAAGLGVSDSSGHDWSFDAVLLPIMWGHELEHAEQIATWRTTQKIGPEATPNGAVLRAAVRAARRELLSVVALIPHHERDSRPVCGEWTLHDIVGHVADWEWLGVQGLRHMASGQPPVVEHVTDLDGWNKGHVAARRDQPWEMVWQDLQESGGALVDALEGMDEETLNRPFSTPWGARGSPYQWVLVYIDHDRTHARDLQSWRQVP